MIDDPQFWSKVSIGNECWEWRGALDSKGYGQVMRRALRAASIRAHRYAIDYWGSGVVMHECDNRRCVRPGHLSVGTVGDNNRDCAAKGRTRNGYS